jgi:hypothetical protein
MICGVMTAVVAVWFRRCIWNPLSLAAWLQYRYVGYYFQEGGLGEYVKGREYHVKVRLAGV